MSSETAIVRADVLKYLEGYGLDLGFGGDAVVPWAIAIDRAPTDPVRAKCGKDHTHLAWDIFKRLPFDGETFDFVFSSHALEDALDTAGVLAEWCRVLKIGGRLVLYVPDQLRYEAHCATYGGVPNGEHKHPDFGAAYVKARLPECMEIVELLDPFPRCMYSFLMVAKKVEAGS